MNSPPTPNRLFHFLGGDAGVWRVVHMATVSGEALPPVSGLQIIDRGSPPAKTEAGWLLSGIVSNERYVERSEKAALASLQETPGRQQSTCAALIPIRKTSVWWAMTQQDRREIFEAQSAHIAIGLKYLPAIARRLHHCRDLGTPEPFDFLTWFEYEPASAGAFEDLVQALRASPEWTFVDREVDIRLVRAGA